MERKDPRDGRYGLLRDPRCRSLCAYVIKSGEEVFSLDELAEQLLDREQETQQSAAHLQRIRIKLHHLHLPKLADIGLIEYDARSHTVRYRKSQTSDHTWELMKEITRTDHAQVDTNI